MPDHVQVQLLRDHDAELGQQVAVCWNGTRSSSAEGVSQGGGDAVDYGNPISERSDLWPVHGKCGFGLGRFGAGSFGYGQQHGPANWGFGFGYFGYGQFGIYCDRFGWATTHARPRLEGLCDGPYRFGLRMYDVTGNRDPAAGPESTIVVKNTPRPARELSASAGTGSISLSWTKSQDVGGA